MGCFKVWPLETWKLKRKTPAYQIDEKKKKPNALAYRKLAVIFGPETWVGVLNPGRTLRMTEIPALPPEGGA